eukprot:15575_3
MVEGVEVVLAKCGNVAAGLEGLDGLEEGLEFVFVVGLCVCRVMGRGMGGVLGADGCRARPDTERHVLEIPINTGFDDNLFRDGCGLEVGRYFSEMLQGRFTMSFATISSSGPTIPNMITATDQRKPWKREQQPDLSEALQLKPSSHLIARNVIANNRRDTYSRASRCIDTPTKKASIQNISGRDFLKSLRCSSDTSGSVVDPAWLALSRTPTVSLASPRNDS